MKILILHKFLIAGGIERVLLSQLPLFSQLGHQTDLLLTYNVENQAGHLQSLLEPSQNVDFVFSARQSDDLLSWQKNKKRSLKAKLCYEFSRFFTRSRLQQKIKLSLHQQDYDLIIDFSGILDKTPHKASWQIPIIRWLHSDNDVQHLLHHPKRFQDYAKIVAITQAMLNRITQASVLPAEKFSVIYNPLNLNEIRQKAQSPIHLADQDYLLVVSRLVQGKGLFELIEIYARLKAKGISNKLYIVGDGELKEELQQRIEQLGLEKACLLLGGTDNPYPYFRSAKLFTFTSENEGLGMVILESMACGTPTVVMDCPTGPQEILGQSQYGVLVPLHDKGAFVNAVLNLLNKPTLYQHYVDQGLQRCRDFSADQVVIQLDRLLHTCQRK